MTRPGGEPGGPTAAPNALSGVVDCPGKLTFRELVESAQRYGWSVDGLQPQGADATLAELLTRRQPRPVLWASGMLPERCVRYVVARPGKPGYTSIRVPRKASGPDWAYLFVGNGADWGDLVEVSVSLVRPAARYLLAEAHCDDPAALFRLARSIALLEPFSTRRLDWRERRLAAAVPARRGLVEAMSTPLQALGCSLELLTGVPDSLRYLAPSEREGPALVVSGAYDLVADAIAEIEAAPGSEPFVLLRHADSHGLEAFVGVGPGEAARLDSAWARLVEAGPELHDARRRDDGDDWRWLAPRFDFGGPS